MIYGKSDRLLSQQSAVPQKSDEYFEALIMSADTKNLTSNYRETHRSRIERLKLFTSVFGFMKKLPASGFIAELNKLFMELIKFPDAEYQSLVLDCVKKTEVGGKIVGQYYNLLKKLISRESFKATLLDLNL